MFHTIQLYKNANSEIVFYPEKYVNLENNNKKEEKIEGKIVMEPRIYYFWCNNKNNFGIKKKKRFCV
jgi:hypothetical protein